MINVQRVSVLGLTGLAWWLSAAGCSEALPAATSAASTSLVATGAGGSSPCHGYYPDGFCAIHAAEPESCACADCTESASCTKKCTDDGKCDTDSGEDCTCADCFFKSSKCAPPNGFCNDNDMGVCSTSENCTCKDCTNTEYCKSHCDDNGECVPFFEGCACADCKMLKECGGSSSASSSTAASSTASSAASSGAGGGGTGGAGGGK